MEGYTITNPINLRQDVIDTEIDADDIIDVESPAELSPPFTPPSVQIIETTAGDLPPKHNQIARLAALGFNNREIGERIGMHPARVSEVKNSGLCQAVIADIRGELDECTKKAQNLLIEGAPEAAEVLLSTMRNKEAPRLAKEAAVEILKGTGAIIKEKVGGDNGITVNIGEAKMELLIATLKEIRR